MYEKSYGGIMRGKKRVVMMGSKEGVDTMTDD